MRSDPRFVTNRGERSRERRHEAHTIRGRHKRTVVATTLTDRLTTESPNPERHNAPLSPHRPNAPNHHREPNTEPHNAR
jgi:hypothetical protein